MIALTAPSPFAAMPVRHWVVLTTVLTAHAAALWLLQQGLAQRPAEALVPAEILVKWISAAPTPAVPAVPAAPAATPATPRVAQRPAPALARPTQPPSPVPTPVPTPVPAPAAPAPAPVASSTDAPPAASAPGPAAPSTTANTAATGPATPPPARVELPSASADYLNNPRPPYPGLSKRLGEQGKVVLRVFIEADGSASRAEIRTSSGYERLDQTALQTVLRWRYVPGKRNGVAEAMWFNIPINFVLE